MSKEVLEYGNTIGTEKTEVDTKTIDKGPDFNPDIPSDNSENMEAEIEKYENIRDALYKKDIENELDDKQKIEKESAFNVLENHNKTVLTYAMEIVRQMPNLSKEERVAAIIATMLHDSGKLNSKLLEHHIEGSKRAKEILGGMKGLTIDGVLIDDAFIKTVCLAIEGHMNHPFLVYLNGGNRFREPENNVGKIVFDADMAANIGFKNVGVRLGSEQYLKEDKEIAKAKGTTIIEESFSNVVLGAKSLKNVFLLKEGAAIGEGAMEQLVDIFQYMKSKGMFQEIQDSFSENGNFDITTIKSKGGFGVMKNFINEKIEKSGRHLGVDIKTIKFFKI